MKPNCSTCRCEFDDCKSKVYGLACLEHPNAREYLMKDVIEELGRAIKTCDVPDKEDAYDYAISLIKNGVDGK